MSKGDRQEEKISRGSAPASLLLVFVRGHSLSALYHYFLFAAYSKMRTFTHLGSILEVVHL